MVEIKIRKYINNTFINPVKQSEQLAQQGDVKRNRL